MFDICCAPYAAQHTLGQPTDCHVGGWAHNVFVVPRLFFQTKDPKCFLDVLFIPSRSDQPWPTAWHSATWPHNGATVLDIADWQSEHCPKKLDILHRDSETSVIWNGLLARDAICKFRVTGGGGRVAGFR